MGLNLTDEDKGLKFQSQQKCSQMSQRIRIFLKKVRAIMLNEKLGEIISQQNSLSMPFSKFPSLWLPHKALTLCPS